MPHRGNRMTDAGIESQEVPMPLRYRIGDIVLDSGTHEVSRDGQALDVSGLSYRLMLALVQQAPNVVSHDKLVELVWPGRIVSPETVTQRIKLTRQAIDDDAQEPRYIGLVRGEGYRLLANVEVLSPEDAPISQTLVAELRRRRVLQVAFLIGLLVLALSYFAFDKFIFDPARDVEMVGEATEQARADALLESFGDNSIAVLAFSDMSPDGDQEYLSDGIAEEILNLLAKIPELRVVSRSSAFSFKGQDIDIRTVAKQLNVAHVLEGSVQKSGDRIRISAKLIEAGTDRLLWSETYDRVLDDIFAIQDDISKDVIEKLKVTLLGAMPRGRQTDPQVYSLYLQGKYFNNLRGKENLEKALAAFKEALAIDPNYAPAWVGIQLTYSLQILHGQRSKEENFALAMEAAMKALAIDENLAVAWAGLAYLKRTYQWDWQGASGAIEMALRLEPNNVDVLEVAAALAGTLGRLSDSIELYERAVELDPLRLSFLRSLGHRYRSAGRFDDALAAYQRVLAMNSSYPGIRASLSHLYMLKGDPERALAELQKEKDPDFKFFAVGAANIEYTLGNDVQAQSYLNELLEGNTKVFPYGIAAVYAWRGQNDAAFDWLEQAYEQKEFRLAYFLGNVEFRNLTRDPRYPIFVEKLGLLQEWEAMPPEYGGPSKPLAENVR